MQGVAVSSYQGGHVEYFEYLVESLRERGAGHVKVVGGGGGVIVAEEIARLRARRGHDLLPRGRPAARPGRDDQHGDRRTATSICGTQSRPTPSRRARRRPGRRRPGDHRRRARHARRRSSWTQVRAAAAAPGTPVLGITGTGGSGKSSLTDELVRRFRLDQQDKLRDRGDRGRPDPPARRRRAARRPDPDELPRRRPGLLPLAGHPRQPRAAGAPRRRDRRGARRPASTW